jgi:hypothetical protein
VPVPGASGGAGTVSPVLRRVAEVRLSRGGWRVLRLVLVAAGGPGPRGQRRMRRSGRGGGNVAGYVGFVDALVIAEAGITGGSVMGGRRGCLSCAGAHVAAMMSHDVRRWVDSGHDCLPALAVQDEISGMRGGDR